MVNATSGWHKDLGPYPAGAALSMVDYGNQHRKCANAAMTLFLQYLPYVLLIQALMLTLVLKFLLKLPKISGKVERFYYTIVKNSLFGKDPDVAEDVCDEKSNAEAISRRRQRNEVCNSLKRSNIIHFIYVLRNITNIMLIMLFVPFNIYFSFLSEDNIYPSVCILPMKPDPVLQYGAGEIHYQCSGKRITFFFVLIFCNAILQIISFICSAGSLVWCLYYRSISNLLNDMEEVSSAKDIIIQIKEGKDFIFLFDLLAHNLGIESTLRVLTHSDDTFHQICRPRLKTSENDYVQVEENKVKVVWQAARIEKWLVTNINNLMVDSYDVTIFPAETSRHTITKMAKGEEDLVNDDYYSAVFDDLNGGKVEYIVTIACVIGKSRMKGQRIITTLLPFGPEASRAGIVKSCSTTEVEITWEPPRGEFSKYVLLVDPCLSSIQYTIPDYRKGSSISTISNTTTSTLVSACEGRDSETQNLVLSEEGWSRELNYRETSFTITGLNPGEPYLIYLKSKTGDHECRKPLCGIVMTNPEPVNNLSIQKLSIDSLHICWEIPDGHSRLDSFEVNVLSKDGKIKKKLDIAREIGKWTDHNYLIDDLVPAMEFTITMTSICRYATIETLSCEETLQFITKPYPPRDLHLETQCCNSFSVAWESPLFLG